MISAEIIQRCIDQAYEIPKGGHVAVPLASGGHEASTLRALQKGNKGVTLMD